MRNFPCYPSRRVSSVSSGNVDKNLRATIDLVQNRNGNNLDGTTDRKPSAGHQRTAITYCGRFNENITRGIFSNVISDKHIVIGRNYQARNHLDHMLKFLSHATNRNQHIFIDKCLNWTRATSRQEATPGRILRYPIRSPLGSIEANTRVSYPIGTRTFVSTSPLQMSGNAREENNKYEAREITFKTSFGHIACLEWGQREAPNKILCAHGWLDNAGSFEGLIPCILKHRDNYSKYHVVAMDMPGVGHSSHRPPGAEYTTFSHVIEMRRVTQQLGWNTNLTIMGHSLGGHLCFLYSCIYPKQVSSMISIDTSHPLTHQAANWHVNIGNSIDHYFKCEDYGTHNEKLDAVVLVYSEAGAIKRLMEAHSSSLTLESAKIMFKRGATKHPDGSCTFNRDVRLRHLSVEFRPDDELMLKFLEHTLRPDNMLIIRALRSPYHRPEEMRLRYYSLFERNCKLFRDTMLDGTHHLHMNTPELVAIEINRFLEDAEAARAKTGEETADGREKPLISKPNL